MNQQVAISISRDHSNWSISSKGAIPSIVRHAVEVFGFLIPRNSKVDVKEFAGLILSYSDNAKSISVASELTMLVPTNSAS